MRGRWAWGNILNILQPNLAGAKKFFILLEKKLKVEATKFDVPRGH